MIISRFGTIPNDLLIKMGGFIEADKNGKEVNRLSRTPLQKDKEKLHLQYDSNLPLPAEA